MYIDTFGRFLGELLNEFSIYNSSFVDCELPGVINYSTNCYIAFHLHVAEESAQLSGQIIKDKL